MKVRPAHWHSFSQSWVRSVVCTAWPGSYNSGISKQAIPHQLVRIVPRVPKGRQRARPHPHADTTIHTSLSDMHVDGRCDRAVSHQRCQMKSRRQPSRAASHHGYPQLVAAAASRQQALCCSCPAGGKARAACTTDPTNHRHCCCCCWLNSGAGGGNASEYKMGEGRNMKKRDRK